MPRILGSGLGFEYRMFGALPAHVDRDRANATVQSMVSWSGLWIPQCRTAFVLVHESENPAELQTLLDRLKKGPSLA